MKGRDALQGMSGVTMAMARWLRGSARSLLVIVCMLALARLPGLELWINGGYNAIAVTTPNLVIAPANFLIGQANPLNKVVINTPVGPGGEIYNGVYAFNYTLQNGPGIYRFDYYIAIPFHVLACSTVVNYNPPPPEDIVIPQGVYSQAHYFPTSGLVKTVQSIEGGIGTTRVTAGGTLVARATQSITLKPGFVAEAGSTVRVMLNRPPIISVAGTVTPEVVTGASAQLSIRGDGDLDESRLIYRWDLANPGSAPGGYSFSRNGDNLAKTVTVNFVSQGTYDFVCTITDTFGFNVTSPVVRATVVRTLTQIQITPPSVQLNPLAMANFSAEGRDQFGVVMGLVNPTWSMTGGDITTTGMATAGSVPGTYAAQMRSGGITGSAVVTIVTGTTDYPAITTSVIAAETTYVQSPALGGAGVVHNHSYDWHQGVSRVSRHSVSLPVVSTAQNGSGTAVSVDVVTDARGNPVWTKDEEGFITYREFDPGTQALVRVIRDVDTSRVADLTGLPAGWTTPVGGGAHQGTSFRVDNLGRATKTTDQDGHVTYTVYNDRAFEIRTYAGWDVATGQPTGPVGYRAEKRATNQRVSGAYLRSTYLTTAGEPNGSETIDAADWVALQTDTLDDNYRVFKRADSVTSGVSEDTYLTYDSRGRLERTQDPAGTVTRTVYDILSRPVTRWMGAGSKIGESQSTVDTGWPASHTMEKVEEVTYDTRFDAAGAVVAGSGIGNGVATLTRTWDGSDGPGGTKTSYATYRVADFRDRVWAVRTPDGMVTVSDLDFLGRITGVRSYAGGGCDGSIVAGNLRGKSAARYDERGQINQTTVWGVDAANGAVGAGLVTNTWYSPRGLAVKVQSPTGLFTKTVYDGLGQVVRVAKGVDASETTYADAMTRTGDQIVEAVENCYAGDGRLVAVTSLRRKEGDTSTTGDLTWATAFGTVSVVWSDRAHRQIATADYGRDTGRLVYDAAGSLVKTGAVPAVAAADPPTPGADDAHVLVTRRTYPTASDRLTTRVTDARGVVSTATTDRRGRTVRTVGNYVDGVCANDERGTDRIVESAYELARLKSQTAWVANPAVTPQTTTYLYESSRNATWATAIIYPDSGGATDRVQMAYDLLGRVYWRKDQRGVERTFTFDQAGRPWQDKVKEGSLPTGVAESDGGVRLIERGYDDAGRLQTITSKDAAGSVVNQVALAYNAFGQVIKSSQEHAGVVNGATPAVNYGFATGAAGTIRLESMVYPGGNRTVYYRYPASGLGAALDRVSGVAEDAAGNTTLASYAYLGSSQVTSVTLPATANLATSVAANDYAGLDGFGRVTTSTWTTAGGGAVLAGHSLAYDANGNRTLRAPAWSGAPAETAEGFTYDGLNRLTKHNRGTAANGAVADGATTWTQRWTLDYTNVWRQMQSGAPASLSTQDRSHNLANEITAITAAVVPTYDAAGAMSSLPVADAAGTRQHLSWDAWGRLVTVKADSGGVPGADLATYGYDGLHRRIRVAQGGVTDHVYYSESWQELEIRRNGSSSPYEQYVWDVRFLDAPLRRYRSAGNTGAINETIAYLPDSSWSPAAIVDTNGVVLERYRFDAYGKRTILDQDGVTIRSVSAYDNRIAFTGRRFDVEVGLHYFRNRYYHHDLGQFISRDPMGYVDGMSLYAGYFAPMGWDPYGLREEGTWSQRLSRGVGDLRGRWKRSLNESGMNWVGAGLLNSALDLGLAPIEGTLNSGTGTGEAWARDHSDALDAFCDIGGSAANDIGTVIGSGLAVGGFTATTASSVRNMAKVQIQNTERGVVVGLGEGGGGAEVATARAMPQGAPNKGLSPTNYPNPDPAMSVPPVRYEPSSLAEVERMRKGIGPTSKASQGTGNIEAHHRQQIPISQGGVMDELAMQTHRGVGNHSRHSAPSQLTPAQRAQEIREHWRQRGAEYIMPGEGL